MTPAQRGVLDGPRGATGSVLDPIDELRAQLASGLAPPLRGSLPRRVRRSVELATDLGAPALPALDAATSALADERAAERVAHVATAQARAVVLALAALPVVGLPGLGALLGAPLLAFYATSAGAVVLAVGASLAAAGVLLARSITRRSGRARLDGTDEVLDLVATALTAGLSPASALRRVAAHRPDRAAALRRLALAIELGSPPPAPDDLGALAGVLRTSVAFGAPAAPALRRLAHDLRADERARVEAASQRLPALLTFPTVLFLLPSSLLLLGAPVLVTGLDAVTGA